MRRVMMLATAATALAAAGAEAQAPGKGLPSPVAQFDADIARMVAEWNAPGLAIAVVRNDSVLLSKGYGVRELGKPEMIDAGTRFAIGSTTKAMTVMALGMLVDEGKVRWDEPVITYLPGFRLSDAYVTRELTVRDLLTHRSGLGNADRLWSGNDYTPDEIFHRVGTLPLAYSFRAGWVYQNVMYALAGAVVHAASGMTWDDFLTSRIFTPLGMVSTVTRLSQVTGQPNVAAPHGEIDDTLRVITNRPVDAVAPAGAVWSSVGDMAKWMRFILDSGRVGGKRLIAQSTFNEIFRPQVMADRSTYPTLDIVRPRFFTYGLGWFLHDYAGQGVAMHTGSIDGMSAIIGLLPDKRVGVYVLANADHVELRHALMFEAFDRFGGTASGAAAGRHNWSAELLALYNGLRDRGREAQRQQLQRRVTGTAPSLAVARYAGTYRHGTYGDVQITVHGDTLHARFGNAFDGDLTHWQFDTFRARWVDRRSGDGMLVFGPDGSGGVGTVRMVGLTFTRVAAR